MQHGSLLLIPAYPLVRPKMPASFQLSWGYTRYHHVRTSSMAYCRCILKVKADSVTNKSHNSRSYWCGDPANDRDMTTFILSQWCQCYNCSGSWEIGAGKIIWLLMLHHRAPPPHVVRDRMRQCTVELKRNNQRRTTMELRESEQDPGRPCSGQSDVASRW
jgi:hypothetical protein